MKVFTLISLWICASALQFGCEQQDTRISYPAYHHRDNGWRYAKMLRTSASLRPTEDLMLRRDHAQICGL
jgi:hypothetical protein